MQNSLFRNLHSKFKKAVAVALTLTTVATLTPSVSYEANAATALDPETVGKYSYYMAPIKADADKDGSDEVVWSTFTYGSYPTSQVTDDATLAELEAASDWTEITNPYIDYIEDDNYAGYTTINGTKYLRMKINDTTGGNAAEANGLYTWENLDEYHYFKYEPITWRVLSVNEDGTDALVISDQVIDDQAFSYESYAVGGKNACNWKYSTLRSFLNGLDGSANKYDADYSGNYNFLDMAFTKEEQSNILTSSLKNDEGNFSYLNGSSTTDKIFCLSYKDINTTAYGFIADGNRVAIATDYTKQMGSFGYGMTAFWWTRSAGDGATRVSNIDYQGDIHAGGNNADSTWVGVRPSMHINISDLTSANFAGYVDSERHYYANRVIFNLNGTKTYTYTNATSNRITKPYKYEQDGYNYSYSITNNGVTTTIPSFPITTKKNCTINVTRTLINESCIIVYYKAPSNWSNVYIHYKVANGSWTKVPGVKMEKTSELDGYTYKYIINCDNATSATVCFTNGSNDWDSLGGRNYTLKNLGTYGIKETVIKTISTPTATPVVTNAPTKTPTATPVVTVAPTEAPTVTPVVTVAPTEAPTATPVVTVAPTETPVAKTITVYYSTGWEAPYIHFKTGNKAWTAVPGVKMEKTSEVNGYNYKYTINLGDETNATVCFNNGNNSWDSKNGNNYYLSSTGSYGVKNGCISTIK